MSTAMKTPGKFVERPPRADDRSDDQLRHDRMLGIVAIIIMVLLTALLIWLSSLGGGNGVHEIDYWPMM